MPTHSLGPWLVQRQQLEYLLPTFDTGTGDSSLTGTDYGQFRDCQVSQLQFGTLVGSETAFGMTFDSGLY